MSKSLSKLMRDNALEGLSDNHTIKVYKKDITRFATYCRDNELNKRTVLDDPVSVIQAYTDDLNQQGYSPSTIHRYIASPCKGLGVSMDKIVKPKREIDKISRSRGGRNSQGQRELENPKYARLVQLQKAVGIRRAELAKLEGRDLQRDENGYYIHVRQGKGGKEQLQRILPQDIETVKTVFEGIGDYEKVFSKAEMQNHLDLHGLRGQHARDCYTYYKKKIDENPDYKVHLIKEIQEYCTKMQKDGKYSTVYKRMNEDMKKGNNIYKLRGKSVEIAEAKGRPTTYDRVALMAVSVFHLSHWRNDVTVINYMLS